MESQKLIHIPEKKEVSIALPEEKSIVIPNQNSESVKELMEESKPVYLVGDVHGYFSSLFHKIDIYGVHDCYLICVGDLGIGFKYSTDGELSGMIQLNKYFKEKNITFMSIRGNHDDPWYWGVGRNGHKVDYSHFKLLKDYTTMNLNGDRFLFVGGGISIDRTLRKLGSSYWTDEVFVLDESKVQECDVLVTHSGPSWIGPFEKSGIQRYCDRDSTLWDDCVKERKDHDALYKLAKPKKSYLGHFHSFQSVEHNGCIATILDELQIWEHRKLPLIPKIADQNYD